MPHSFKLEDLDIQQNSEILALLKRCPQIDLLVFHDGEFLVHEDASDKDTFIVLYGSYVVEHLSADLKDRTPGTLAIVLNEEGSLSFVGEMAYFGGGFRTASVRSTGSTYALRLRSEHLETIIADFPELTTILCKQFTSRLMEANNLLKEIHAQTSLSAKRIIKHPNETVFSRGEKATVLYQLVLGTVTCEDNNKMAGPDDFPFGFLEPGPFFRGGEYTSTIKTESEVFLVAISEESKLAVIRRYPELILDLYNC